MKLRQVWIDRIFERLSGIYGAQFTGKFPNTEEAKRVWAAELGMFDDKPECISFALENLPFERAPNALEFREICRRAPRDEKKREEAPGVPVDPAKVAALSRKVHELTQNEKDHLRWATHPCSQGALDWLAKGSKSDFRLRQILRQHIENGVCTESLRLLKMYRDGEWRKA